MSEGVASVKGQGIVIRALQEVEEMSIGVDLQRRVWGYTEIDTVPDQIFIVARESGGQVLGAFHEDKAIGFALAFAGVHGGKVHLHSHMVAVLPEYQDRGVGRMLKLAERWVRSARVQDLLGGKIPKAGSDHVRIGIPAGIRQIISSNPHEAEKIQAGVRREFERHIAGGRGAVGFEFDAEQGSYVLETYED